MASQGNKDGRTSKREAWSAPAIRSVIPLSHTRGGPFDVNDQDDLNYRVS